MEWGGNGDGDRGEVAYMDEGSRGIGELVYDRGNWWAGVRGGI